MSANVLDMIINNAVAGSTANIWWVNGKKGGADGSSKIVAPTSIRGDETVEDLIQLLNLDWDPIAERLVNPSTKQKSDAWEIYRPDTGDVLATVISAKKVGIPPAPREILEFISSIREQIGAQWATGGLTTTARLWANIRLPQSFVDMGGGDVIHNTLMMMYDYKARKGRTKFCATNVVCDNTLQFALNEKTKVDLDWSDRDDLVSGKLLEMLKGVDERFNQVIDKFGVLQGRNADLRNAPEIITYAHILDTPSVLARVLDAQQRDAGEAYDIVHDLLKSYSMQRATDLSNLGKTIITNMVAGVGQDMEARKDNWYGAIQGVTYAVDHAMGRDADTRIDSGYFGARSDLKSNALEVALIVSDVSKSM